MRRWGYNNECMEGKYIIIKRQKGDANSVNLGEEDNKQLIMNFNQSSFLPHHLDILLY